MLSSASIKRKIAYVMTHLVEKLWNVLDRTLDNNLCDEPKGISMDCNGSNPGCVIIEYNSTSPWWNKCHRTCSGFLDASNEGCFFENDEDGGKTRRCYCGSDFCNENFDTAGWLDNH